MNLLTQNDMIELTGFKNCGKQADFLDSHGVFYFRRNDGSVTTTWYHVNHPAQRIADNDSEPDFSALEA